MEGGVRAAVDDTRYTGSGGEGGKGGAGGAGGAPGVFQSRVSSTRDATFCSSALLPPVCPLGLVPASENEALGRGVGGGGGGMGGETSENEALKTKFAPTGSRKKMVT